MKRAISSAFCVAALLSPSEIVNAAAESVRAPRCGDGRDTSEAVNACSSELARLEVRLAWLISEFKKQSIHGIDAENLKSLRSAQENWQQYRLFHCRWMADQYRGGTLAGVVEVRCRVDETQRRVAELRKHLDSLKNR